MEVSCTLGVGEGGGWEGWWRVCRGGGREKPCPPLALGAEPFVRCIMGGLTCAGLNSLPEINCMITSRDVNCPLRNSNQI